MSKVEAIAWISVPLIMIGAIGYILFSLGNAWIDSRIEKRGHNHSLESDQHRHSHIHPWEVVR